MIDTENKTERGEGQRLRQREERNKDYNRKRRDTKITRERGAIRRLQQREERD